MSYAVAILTVASFSLVLGLIVAFVGAGVVEFVRFVRGR